MRFLHVDHLAGHLYGAHIPFVVVFLAFVAAMVFFNRKGAP